MRNLSLSSWLMGGPSSNARTVQCQIEVIDRVDDPVKPKHHLDEVETWQIGHAARCDVDVLLVSVDSCAAAGGFATAGCEAAATGLSLAS